MEANASFGDWLRRRRKALDLTQEELAQRVGCVAGTIKSIEADQRRPSKQLAARLAACMELPEAERAAFLRAARAELSADRLAHPTQDILQGTFVPATALPSGTVTFLFTDIAGSARLWEANPQAMAVALDRHNAILTEVIAAHAGALVKTTGDGVLAAFAQAIDALSAARTAQHALQTEDWRTAGLSEEQPLRVRMALHTGVAEPHAGDYVGSPLNRAARLLAAAHGGQIVLSRATWELVADQLPADVQLRDLGMHRLKDLSRPEQVFQLVAPDLPVDFPALRTLDARPTNLPVQPTALIGRERQLMELGALLKNPTCRLITIVGPGGIGKTRLALAAATDQATAFTHGAAFVPLTALSSAAFLAPAILAALKLGLHGQRDPREQLLAYLREKELLLVLDSFEQLLVPDLSENEGGAALLTEVLQHAPSVTLLVTSRERLALQGEWLFDVSGLSYPLGEPTAGFESYAAVELFVQRAGQVRRQFAFAEGEARAVARICRLVEGLPLAIELAAAGVRSRSCAAIAAAIESGLSVLSTGQRAIPKRHHSIWATFEHSWRLLSDAERQVLRRLSVFRGGFQEGAAVQVAQASPQLLAALVDKSLLRWDGTSHFELHELVRQYAGEKLREIDEEAQIRDRHLTYFLRLAEQAEPELIGPQTTTWLRRINHEVNNIRAALEWSLQNDIQAGLQLASALRRYWVGHSPLEEGVSWLTQLLRHPRAAAHTAARAKALTALGWLNAWQNEYATAREQAEEGLALYRALGDRHGVASALLVLGGARCLQEGYATARPLLLESLALYRALGDIFGIAEVLTFLGQWESNRDATQARAYLEEALRLCQELGNIVGISNLLENLGEAALWQGEYDAAHAWLTQALDLQRSLNVAGVASVISTLGELALWQGEYEQARAYFEESVALCRESGQTGVGLWPLVRLGYVALRQGDAERAGALFVEGLQRFKDVENRIGVVYTLEGLASLAVAQGRPMQAVRMFAWADAMRGTIANARPPVEQADVDRDFASIRTQLNEATIDTVRAEGRAMTLEQASAYGLEGAPQPPLRQSVASSTQ